MRNMILQLTILSLMLAACNQNQLKADSSVDPTTAVVESATSIIGGIADDQDGSSYAIRTPSWKHDLVLPRAYASTCSRAVYSSCVAGIKNQSYTDCNIGTSNFELNGSVSLIYSNSICDLSSVGSSVDRTYNLTISGPRGGELLISSSSRADYKNSIYGGGGKLTTTAGGWDMEVLGKHKTLSYKGKNLYDISVRTTVPLAVTGSLSRSSRNINSGQLEVNHNISGFTALFTPQNLQWSNSCCHPVSGSLSIVWSGSKTGTATVNFQGCGQAQVNENGQTRDIELSYCE